MRTFNWLNRWSVLPRPGGLEDQDKTWVEDMERMASMKDQVQREYNVYKEAERKRNAGQ